VDILHASHVKPVQTAAIKLMREVALDPFSALPLQSFASLALHAPPVGIHRCLRGLFASPVASASIRFSHITTHTQFLETNGNVVTVIPLVRHDFFDSKRMHFILPFGSLFRD
jgi:hypothetical protein